MGWVSMREDQIDRASEQLEALRSEMGVTPAAAAALTPVLNRAEVVVREARSLLSLATEPGVDLALQNIELSQQIMDLKADWNTKFAEFERRVAEKDQKLREQKKLNRELERQVQRSRDFFARNFGREKLKAFDDFISAR